MALGVWLLTALDRLWEVRCDIFFVYISQVPGVLLALQASFLCGILGGFVLAFWESGFYNCTRNDIDFHRHSSKRFSLVETLNFLQSMRLFF